MVGGGCCAGMTGLVGSVVVCDVVAVGGGWVLAGALFGVDVVGVGLLLFLGGWVARFGKVVVDFFVGREGKFSV